MKTETPVTLRRTIVRPPPGVRWAALFVSLAAVPQWNAAPWLADLAQIRTAIDHDYPNRDWLTTEREVSLDQWFDRAAAVAGVPRRPTTRQSNLRADFRR